MKANVKSSEMLCPYCEELVSNGLTHCPYCQNSLLNTKTVKGASAAIENPFANFQQLNEEFVTKQEPLSFSGQSFFVILSLAALLAGSFFFFFGILVKLYATGGVFSLEWNAASWPYFMAFAVLLVIVVLSALSKIDK
jgi:hypothetical protein